MKEIKFLLKRDDYDYIDDFCKKMLIPEGSGIRNILGIFINRLYKEGRLK